MTEHTVYEIKDLLKSYNGRNVVDVPKLQIFKGDLFVLVGPSGSGKSTFLRLLNSIENPNSGNIKFSLETTISSNGQNNQRQVSMVFQTPEFLNRTVTENVSYPLWLRGKRDPALVEKVIERMQLRGLKQEKARNLSGGESQRLAIARALVIKPSVLLLDEPTANLDPYNVELIEKIILEFNWEGNTVILVTHNVFQARRLAKTAGLILNGMLIETGSANHFFNQPNDKRVKDFLNGKMIY